MVFSNTEIELYVLYRKAFDYVETIVILVCLKISFNSFNNEITVFTK